MFEIATGKYVFRGCMAVESDSPATSEDLRTISGVSTCTLRISGVGTDAAGLMMGKDSFSFTLTGLRASASGEGSRAGDFASGGVLNAVEG